MELRTFHAKSIAPIGISFVLTVALGGLVGSGNNPPVKALSCFTIAGQVTCIDAGGSTVAPIIPPIHGPIFGGEDEEIVMSDNGGYQVERG
jgi:hypothetical protein